MKTNIASIVALAFVTSTSLAQGASFNVATVKLANSDLQAGNPLDAEFRIKAADADPPVPELHIPTYSSSRVRTRVVDVRLSHNRMEVAIQEDEFGIGYFDYRLDGGGWVPGEAKHICSLSGPLSLALAQVDILEGEIVEVKYHAAG